MWVEGNEGILGMGMASCGDDSIELNSMINSKMKTKKLRLGEEKCFKIHECK